MGQPIYLDPPERKATADLFTCWWGMIETQEECLDRPPIDDGALILHFTGSGASCMVFAKDIREVCRIIREHKTAQAAPKPSVREWLDNELIGAQQFYPDDDSMRAGYQSALEALQQFLDIP